MKEKKRMAHKRVFFALLVMVAGIVLPVASARADDGKAELAVSCGVKAEANMSGQIRTGSEKVETGMRPGLSLGGFLNLQVSSHFSVQADFLLHYKNSIRMPHWGTMCISVERFRFISFIIFSQLH